jgi:hypothetical protein
LNAHLADRIRQLTVTASGIACLVGTLYGIGVLGTAVEESSGGRLSADATLIAPAGPAFSIWSVIYAGLAAFTIWQWLPAATAHPRARAIGWLAAASMLLNAGWLLVTQFGWLLASVAVILVLLGILITLVRRLTEHSPTGAVEKIILDGTFGLYLGWVSVATFANIAAGLAPGDRESSSPSALAEVAAVATLCVVTAVGLGLARILGGRVSVAVAMAWGLGWIAVGRTFEAPRSTATALAAIAAAIIVAGSPAFGRRQRP